MSRDQILWKDVSIRKIIFVFITIITLTAWLIIFSNLLIKPKLTLDYFSIFIVFIFTLLILLVMLRTRLTRIFQSGITIGNSPTDEFRNYNLKKNPTHLYWGSIEKIKIFGKEIRRPTHMENINILSIKTKDNKKFECFIADPNGFVETLRKLKKDKLISKNSKFKK